MQYLSHTAITNRFTGFWQAVTVHKCFSHMFNEACSLTVSVEGRDIVSTDAINNES